MTLNEDECAAAGIDPKKIASIARRIERAAVEDHLVAIVLPSAGMLRELGAVGPSGRRSTRSPDGKNLG